jgi:hypothetical protein
MNSSSWISALMGAIVGGAISLFSQYLIFYYNRNKETKRLQIAVVARLSGSMDNLMNAVFRTMEASLWCYYAVEARRYDIKLDLDIPTLLKFERERLLEYDRLRGEVEIGLSEYWGYVGNGDAEFTKLIGQYRKCSLPSDEVKLVFESRGEIENFHITNHLSKVREALEKSETSHFTVCKNITSHLRFFIAPV